MNSWTVMLNHGIDNWPAKYKPAPALQWMGHHWTLLMSCRKSFSNSYFFKETEERKVKYETG